MCITIYHYRMLCTPNRYCVLCGVPCTEPRIIAPLAPAESVRFTDPALAAMLRSDRHHVHDQTNSPCWTQVWHSLKVGQRPTHPIIDSQRVATEPRDIPAHAYCLMAMLSAIGLSKPDDLDIALGTMLYFVPLRAPWHKGTEEGPVTRVRWQPESWMGTQSQLARWDGSLNSHLLAVSHRFPSARRFRADQGISV